ncbi:hypothetical protein M427DRAFT_134340 [Gonapodya prolifera JEL478]|uniref:Uncharacterized protein n=1 Tax=Gonapodya prolifera (strain JEL478) TaxID=1344416 RepID=A0A139AI02_GONPJ|nr:hypothetical protein M427DRAFT_134340 [Gonapodya prolifera JEL478]|eukprot:KXS16319.1 hypothetical protein M427DRAFT_134340 [Gonapodya prolifera JEL478]
MQFSTAHAAAHRCPPTPPPSPHADCRSECPPPAHPAHRRRISWDETVVVLQTYPREVYDRSSVPPARLSMKDVVEVLEMRQEYRLACPPSPVSPSSSTAAALPSTPFDESQGHGDHTFHSPPPSHSALLSESPTEAKDDWFFPPASVQMGCVRRSRRFRRGSAGSVGSAGSDAAGSGNDDEWRAVEGEVAYL